MGSPGLLVRGVDTGVSPEAVAERFWASLEKGESCWLWTGQSDGKGYGYLDFSVRSQRHRFKASRLSWVLHHGPIPDGMQVCHHCDNPPCVRPDHLFLGTNSDNQLDRYVKGRGAKGRSPGASNPRAKLTELDVLQIRDRYRGGETTRHLADAFHMNHATIWRIVTGKRWAHIQ